MFSKLINALRGRSAQKTTDAPEEQHSCSLSTPYGHFVLRNAADSITIKRYRGPGGDVVIPEKIRQATVGTIWNNAFRGCKTLTSVSIPGSVKSIYWAAFRNCTALTDVIIAEGVEALYNEAFQGCKALRSVTLPASLKTIGLHVFDGCEALTLYVPMGSAAHKYALKNGIPMKFI
ncbi:MAG: leucine-rich repeat domain-containing protein [Clostridia bacterium]|nr:leucine-rich repeat domain-containing protein [Clostridia bacterium]